MMAGSTENAVSHQEMKKKLEEETSRRTTLEAMYKQLFEFRTQQTTQLELVTSSRDSYRNETIKLKILIEKERKQNSATCIALRSATEALMIPIVESSSSSQKQQQTIDTLQTTIRKKDDKLATSESLIESLTQEIETLNLDLKRYESKIQIANEIHAKEIESRMNKESELEQHKIEFKKLEQVCICHIRFDNSLLTFTIVVI